MPYFIFLKIWKFFMFLLCICKKKKGGTPLGSDAPQDKKNLKN